MQINQLPDVKSVWGGRLRDSGEPRSSRVVLQYESHDGNLQEINVPFLDAMYLLNVLKVIQQEMKFEMPDDPRAKN